MIFKIRYKINHKKWKSLFKYISKLDTSLNSSKNLFLVYWRLYSHNKNKKKNTITTRRQKLTKGWGYFFRFLFCKVRDVFFPCCLYTFFVFFLERKRRKPQSIIMDIYICRNFPWGLRIRKLGYKLPELRIGFHFQFNHKIYNFIYFSYLRRFYDNLSRTYKYRPLIFYWSHFSFSYIILYTHYIMEKCFSFSFLPCLFI